MKALIGFWLICLGLTCLYTGIEPTLDFKEKVKLAIGVMSVLTLIIVGACLMGM